MYMYMYIPYSQKFLPGDNFHLSFPNLMGNFFYFYPMNFVSRVNDYVVPMMIFITWVKIYSMKYSVMQEQVGWARCLSGENF